MNTPAFLEASAEAYAIRSTAPARGDALPLTEEMLRHSPSGDLFGLSQDVGMGLSPNDVLKPQMLILSTMGGMRQDDGSPIALGYHTGHWELGLLIKEAALRSRKLGWGPFAAYCSDPCDGRSQGTTAMMDSLAYRNSAAETLGRLIRSLPLAKGVMGIATCDKGLPAMMMALAESHRLPCILVPGGVTLPPDEGEDAGAVQSLGSRFSHGEISLEDASHMGCAACATGGGGCQFLGTAATAQVVAEALGMCLPHTALAPSGEPIWLEMARRSSDALINLAERGIALEQILTRGAFRNAMAVHAAVGGSTNLLIHLPAVAYAGGFPRPKIEAWMDVSAAVPRIVDVLPNGPKNFKTVQLFLAGGVPEVMLRLRDIGQLELKCMTVSGMTVGENLEWWENSEQRKRFRNALKELDGVDPDEVVMTPKVAKQRGFARTLIFPKGNITPDGSVVKSTAIDPSLFNDGVYTHRGPVRVFVTEDSAIQAVKSTGEDRLKPGDIVVLLCRGPVGAGLPETAQITNALKYTKALKHTPLITDGRFSGFSSGPCIGHISPEALAGGPIRKLLDGDIVEILLDSNTGEGRVDLLGSSEDTEEELCIDRGDKLLAGREPRADLQPDPRLPASVRLWAALQLSGGGIWGGCVYDVKKIVNASASWVR